MLPGGRGPRLCQCTFPGMGARRGFAHDAPVVNASRQTCSTRLDAVPGGHRSRRRAVMTRTSRIALDPSGMRRRSRARFFVAASPADEVRGLIVTDASSWTAARGTQRRDAAIRALGAGCDCCVPQGAGGRRHALEKALETERSIVIAFNIAAAAPQVGTMASSSERVPSRVRADVAGGPRLPIASSRRTRRTGAHHVLRSRSCRRRRPGGPYPRRHAIHSFRRSPAAPGCETVEKVSGDGRASV